MYHTDLGDTRENCRLLVTILAIQLIHQWSHKFFQRVSHNQTVCGIRNQGKKLEVGLELLSWQGIPARAPIVLQAAPWFPKALLTTFGVQGRRRNQSRPKPLGRSAAASWSTRSRSVSTSSSRPLLPARLSAATVGRARGEQAALLAYNAHLAVEPMGKLVPGWAILSHAHRAPEIGRVGTRLPQRRFAGFFFASCCLSVMTSFRVLVWWRS